MKLDVAATALEAIAARLQPASGLAEALNEFERFAGEELVASNGLAISDDALLFEATVDVDRFLALLTRQVILEDDAGGYQGTLALSLILEYPSDAARTTQVWGRATDVSSFAAGVRASHSFADLRARPPRLVDYDAEPV